MRQSRKRPCGVKMSKISVLVISQQVLLRRGIEHALSGTGLVEIVGSGQMGDDVLTNIDTAPPDVAVIDVEGTREHGMALAGRIRQRSPSIGVILLTASPSDEQSPSAASSYSSF